MDLDGIDLKLSFFQFFFLIIMESLWYEWNWRTFFSCKNGRCFGNDGVKPHHRLLFKA